MSWIWSSSPPVPQPAPARIVAPDPPNAPPPFDLPPVLHVWWRHKDMFGRGCGAWRCVEFPAGISARIVWIDVWWADFEIVPGEDGKPTSDAP
jgi:hypothetical protein